MSDPEANKIQETIAHPVVIADALGADIWQPSSRQQQEGQRYERGEAIRFLGQTPSIICHATYLVERLGSGKNTNKKAIQQARDTRHFDVCELFAFVVPGVTTTPTPDGLAKALDIPPQISQIETLKSVVAALVGRLSSPRYPHIRETAEIANFLKRGKWPWADVVLQALAASTPDLKLNDFITGLELGNAGANSLDNTRAFVTEDDGEGAAQNAVGD